jgi:uncharacterized membrane-anchored protein YhcB (DUF1043 family)
MTKQPDSQLWLATSLVLANELAVAKEKLESEMYSAERLHIKDLVSFSVKKAAKTEAELDRAQVELDRVRKRRKLLQQQLRDTAEDLEACYQELRYTHRDLADALGSERLMPKEARELAKILVAEGESTREALTRLLNAIYGSKLKPSDLGPRPSVAAQPEVVQDNDCCGQPGQFSSRFVRSKAQFDHLKTKFDRFKVQFDDRKVQFDKNNVVESSASLFSDDS